MAEKRMIYKCNECGNVIEVLHASGGKLICCGQDMELLQANTVDAAVEKHVPVIEQEGDQVTVSVGSTPHPMEEKHYIEFIQLITEARTYTAYLDPGKPPKASFDIRGEIEYARIYCNIHSLWKSS